MIIPSVDDWPSIVSVDDVDPAWSRFRDLAAKFEALVEPYADARRDVPPPKVGRGLDFLPGIGFGVYSNPETMVDRVLQPLIDAADQPPKTAPVTAGDMINTTSVGLYAVAAYWANRRGLDQLRSGRTSATKTVTRSEVRALAVHVDGPLFDALTVTVRGVRLSYVEHLRVIDAQFSAYARGTWSTQPRRRQKPEPKPQPAPIISASFRDHMSL